MSPMMSELIKLAMMALTGDGGLEHSKNAVGRISTAAIYAVGTGVAAIAVLGCLMAALWFYVQPHIGSGGGALTVAAAMSVLWLALFFYTRTTGPSQRAPTTPSRETILTLVTEAQRLFEKNKSSVLLTAVIAGIVAGNTNRSTHADT